MSKTTTHIRCTQCKGENIRFDAWADYDPNTGSYGLSSMHEHTFCVDCEGDCKTETITRIEGEPEGYINLKMDWHEISDYLEETAPKDDIIKFLDATDEEIQFRIKDTLGDIVDELFKDWRQTNPRENYLSRQFICDCGKNWTAFDVYVMDCPNCKTAVRHKDFDKTDPWNPTPEPEGMELLEQMAEEARPNSDEDWGSDRQLRAETKFYTMVAFPITTESVQEIRPDLSPEEAKKVAEHTAKTYETALSYEENIRHTSERLYGQPTTHCDDCGSFAGWEDEGTTCTSCHRGIVKIITYR